MELQTGSQMLYSRSSEQSSDRIEIDGISMACSSGRRPDGSWFALGTIAHLGNERMGPAIVLVGLGADLEDAMSNLTTEAHAAISAHNAN